MNRRIFQVDSDKQTTFFRALDSWHTSIRDKEVINILDDIDFAKILARYCILPSARRLDTGLNRFVECGEENIEEVVAIIIGLFFAATNFRYEGVPQAIIFFRNRTLDALRSQRIIPPKGHMEPDSLDDPNFREPAITPAEDEPYRDALLLLGKKDNPLARKGIVITLLRAGNISFKDMLSWLEGIDPQAASLKWRKLAEEGLFQDKDLPNWDTVIEWFATPPPRLNDKAIRSFFARFQSLLKYQVEHDESGASNNMIS